MTPWLVAAMRSGDLQDPSAPLATPPHAAEQILRAARQKHTNNKSVNVHGVRKSTNHRHRIGLSRLQFGDGEDESCVRSLQRFPAVETTTEVVPERCEIVPTTRTMSRALLATRSSDSDSDSDLILNSGRRCAKDNDDGPILKGLYDHRRLVCETSVSARMVAAYSESQDVQRRFPSQQLSGGIVRQQQQQQQQLRQQQLNSQCDSAGQGEIVPLPPPSPSPQPPSPQPPSPQQPPSQQPPPQRQLDSMGQPTDSSSSRRCSAATDPRTAPPLNLSNRPLVAAATPSAGPMSPPSVTCPHGQAPLQRANQMLKHLRKLSIGRPETGYGSSGGAADIEAVEVAVSPSGSGSGGSGIGGSGIGGSGGIVRPPQSLTCRKTQPPLSPSPQQQELAFANTSSTSSTSARIGGGRVALAVRVGSSVHSTGSPGDASPAAISPGASAGASPRNSTFVSSPNSFTSPSSLAAAAAVAAAASPIPRAKSGPLPSYPSSSFNSSSSLVSPCRASLPLANPNPFAGQSAVLGEAEDGAAPNGRFSSAAAAAAGTIKRAASPALSFSLLPPNSPFLQWPTLAAMYSSAPNSSGSGSGSGDGNGGGNGGGNGCGGSGGVVRGLSRTRTAIGCEVLSHSPPTMRGTGAGAVSGALDGWTRRVPSRQALRRTVTNLSHSSYMYQHPAATALASLDGRGMTGGAECGTSSNQEVEGDGSGGGGGEGDATSGAAVVPLPPPPPASAASELAAAPCESSCAIPANQSRSSLLAPLPGGAFHGLITADRVLGRGADSVGWYRSDS